MSKQSQIISITPYLKNILVDTLHYQTKTTHIARNSLGVPIKIDCMLVHVMDVKKESS